MTDGTGPDVPVVEEVRARRFVVADEHGVARICLSAEGELCSVLLLDQSGFERIALTARPDNGSAIISARTSDQAVRVDLFALDAEGEGDAPTVGVELIDAGNSVGGLTVRSGARARSWTVPLV